jgi:hypothetical protein
MNIDELEGLNLPQLIDQLADVSVPGPITYTPETVGWWVLAASLAIGLAFAAIVVARRRQRNRYRRLALAELQSIASRAPSETTVRDVAALVRRTALTVYPRPEVAHLYGNAWREFLTRSATTDLGPGVDDLVIGPYRPPAAAGTGVVGRESMRELLASANRWIKTHHA